MSLSILCSLLEILSISLPFEQQFCTLYYAMYVVCSAVVYCGCVGFPSHAQQASACYNASRLGMHKRALALLRKYCFYTTVIFEFRWDI